MLNSMMKLSNWLDFCLLINFSFPLDDFMAFKVFQKFFTQQMSLFFKDLNHQGSALVYLDDILLMSNSKPHLLQLFEQLHDIAKKNLKLAPEKTFSVLLTLRSLGHEIGFNIIKPIQSKIAAIHKLLFRLQKSTCWYSLGEWTSIRNLLINFILLWSLCMIYYMIILNFTGILNWKHCLNKVNLPLQKLLRWVYLMQTILS